MHLHPQIRSFLKRRLDKTKFTGLPLTILGVAFFYVLALLGLAFRDFFTSHIVANADAQANVLLYTFRNPAAIKTFIWITLLGKSEPVIVFALSASAILWLWRKKWQIAGLWLTIVGSEGCTFIAKHIFHRARPLNAVFLEESNSFPSGHATIAIAFYGFLTYLLSRGIKKRMYRVLVLLAGLIIMFALGFSRLYLGVHYMSDVQTGYLIGLLWLIAGIGFSEWKLSQKQNENRLTVTKYAKIITAGLALAALAFYIVYGLLYHPAFN